MEISQTNIQKVVSEQPGPDVAAEVTVSTATAIITKADDPFAVLVADSKKHGKPVLVGGKLESSDQALKEDAARACVERETVEEIGTQLIGARFIGVAADPDRDIRLVPPSKLKGAVVEPSLPGSLPENALIKAHYGCPDYLFVGTADEASIRATDELKKPRFIDIRNLEIGDLGAGHDVVVLAYRAMIEQGKDSLPADSLRDFSAAAAEFARQ